MPAPPERRRIPFLLLFLAFMGICFVVPRMRYAMDVALLEMRYAGLVILLLAAFVWVLVKLGPRERE